MSLTSTHSQPMRIPSASVVSRAPVSSHPMTGARRNRSAIAAPAPSRGWFARRYSATIWMGMAATIWMAMWCRALEEGHLRCLTNPVSNYQVPFAIRRIT